MHDHCGKVPYPNPVRAWRATHKLSNPLAVISHKRPHKHNQVYRCPMCNAWHLTHRLPPKRPEFIDPLHTAKRHNLQRLMWEVAA